MNTDLISTKIYSTGLPEWRHGQVTEYTASRTPLRYLLGPCPFCGFVTSNYGTAYSCHRDYCRNNASVFTCSPEPAPEWWNSDIDVKLDGNAWFAVGPDFINLQESDAGFGATPNEAAAALLAIPKQFPPTDGGLHQIWIGNEFHSEGSCLAMTQLLRLYLGHGKDAWLRLPDGTREEGL